MPTNEADDQELIIIVGDEDAPVCEDGVCQL